MNIDPAQQWAQLSLSTRIYLCKRMGFGDYRVYAQYKFDQFTPNSQIELVKLMDEPAT